MLPLDLTLEFSKEEFEAYSRQIILKDIGYKGQLKLKNARVCVAGLGGLGSIIAFQLTAMGIGYIRLVDRDVVERSNLHRQYLYDVETIGFPKVEVAYEKLRKINPYIKLEPFPVSINQFTAETVVKDVDLVIDGLDRISPRYAINRACVKLEIPYIYGAALETYGNVSTLIPKKTPCLECIFSGLKDEELPTCSTVGIHPSTLSVIASIEVAEAINLILGTPRLAGKLLYFSLRDLAIDHIEIPKSNNCAVCSKAAMIQKPKKKLLIEEICGRGGLSTFVVTPPDILDLNISKVKESLERLGAKVKTTGNYGITFNFKGFNVSLLKSGVAVMEGVNSKEDADELYNDVKLVFSS